MMIVLGGMISLGKSTVSKILGEHFGSEVFYESVDDNKILPLFYTMSEEELIDWLDRPPSNNDLDIINNIIFLQRRIDKAIKYIEDNHVSVTQLEAGTGLLDTKDYLLDILGGKE